MIRSIATPRSALVSAVVLVFIAAFISAAILFQYRETATAVAAGTFTITGYAWASTETGTPIPPDVGTGMGWIEMGASGNTLTITDNGSRKRVSGYAWIGGNNGPESPATASPGGWVRFGGLSGCPSIASGYSSCDPEIISDGAGGWEMIGWARACAVTVNGDCTGGSKAANQTGNWDGWISLNCKNHNGCGTSNYAVRIDSAGKFKIAYDQTGSFAWGHDVMGWVNFGKDLGISGLCSSARNYQCLQDSNGNLTISESSGTDIWCNATPTTQTDCSSQNEICDTTGQCSVPPTPVVLDFTVTPLIVRKGDSVQASWDIIVPPGFTCTIDWSGSTPQPINRTGNRNIGPITNNVTVINLACNGTVVASETVRTVGTYYE